MRRYTIAMITRVICIILAVALPYSLFTWLFWIGAIFLPYFAVVIANAQNLHSDEKVAKAKAPTLVITEAEFVVKDHRDA